MRETVLYQIDAVLICVVLALAMVATAWFGARLGGRHARQRADQGKGGLASIENALMGLFGLLLAFTFSGAAARIESRSNLMNEAANAIHGAILRADLYPPAERVAFRALLRQYLDSRIAFYEAGYDQAALDGAIERGRAVQRELWQRAAELAREPANSLASGQMLPALDRMFNLGASRELAAKLHMPDVIVLVLFVVALAAALTSGYAAGHGGSFSLAGHAGFAVLAALVIYVTLDLDRPGRGFIHLDIEEQSFLRLRADLAEIGQPG